MASRGVRIATFLARHRVTTLAATAAITAALAWPMVFMQPTTTASQAPEGPVVEAQRLIDERLADPVHRYFVLVEAPDVLDPTIVRGLWTAMESIRNDPDTGRHLVTDPALGTVGFHSIVDEIDAALQTFGGGIDDATDAEIAAAADAILTRVDPAEVGLPASTERRDGAWHAPAFFATVAVDNASLGGGAGLVAIGSEDLSKEEYARELRTAMSGDGWTTWFVAADLNLTSIEQGTAAGPFIGAALLIVLLIVGLTYRSYWAVVGAGAGLAVLMIWLKGGSNLIGLENDQILATLVPISMISFGVDSFFHSFSRYEEERQIRRGARTAFVVGFASVVGALTLAMSTDSAAFLSNVSSPIESVRQFGIAAAIAAFSAFVVLGIVVPNAVAGLEERRGTLRLSPDTKVELGASLGAALGATAVVLLLVFVDPVAGLVALVVWALAAIGVPLRRTSRVNGAGRPPSEPATVSTRSRILGRAVAAVAHHPTWTLAVAGVVTVAALWSAAHLEVRFDAADYLDPSSDFIVALDKVDTYLGDDGGEPATIYVEGDLTNAAAIDALTDFVRRLRGLDSDYLAHTSDGIVLVDAPYLDLLDDAGIEPDDAAGALGAVIAGNYPPGWNQERIAPALWLGDDGLAATQIVVQIPDSASQANVRGARADLQPLVDDLDAALAAMTPSGRVIVTGSAIYRDEQLGGIFRSMLWSLPIAVAACLLLASAFFRSFRLGGITTIPILLVVAWLYGAMQALGYSINVVTAVIGAVSVGIGIDYATHLTHRFVEEYGHTAEPVEAARRAGGGTGVALLGSSATSIAGFGALAFAPMPMFASYGVLTVVMISLALVAAIFVLPAMLALWTRHATDPASPAPVPAGTLRKPAAITIGLDRGLPDRVARTVTETVLAGGAEHIRLVSGSSSELRSQLGVGVTLAVVVAGPDHRPDPTVEVVPLATDRLAAIGPVPSEGPVPMTVVEDGAVAVAWALHAASAMGRSGMVLHTAVDLHHAVDLAHRTGTVVIASADDVAGQPFDLPVTELPTARQIEVVTTRSAANDPEVFRLVLALDSAFSEDDRLDDLIDLRIDATPDQAAGIRLRP